MFILSFLVAAGEDKASVSTTDVCGSENGEAETESGSSEEVVAASVDAMPECVVVLQDKKDHGQITGF